MWQEIERLIQLSQQPIDDLELERIPGNPERRNYYRFLYHLARWLQPYVALEIGVEGGFASAYLGAATLGYGGHVIGIDHEDKRIVAAQGNYHFIIGKSTAMRTWAQVGAMVQDYGKIGIVYQDSSHHYEASRQEWDLYSGMMDSSAVWICDDITKDFHDKKIDPPGMGMVQYFEGLPGEKRLYKDVLHFGNTQGIVLVNGK